MVKPKCYWIRDFSLGVPKGICKKVGHVKFNGCCAEHSADAIKHTAAEGRAYAKLIADSDSNPALLVEAERVRLVAAGLAYNQLKASAMSVLIETTAPMLEKLSAAKQQRKQIERSAEVVLCEERAAELLASSVESDPAAYGADTFDADAAYEEQLDGDTLEEQLNRPIGNPFGSGAVRRVVEEFEAME